MVMPSATLTLGDKILIQIASGMLFAMSALYGNMRIRSIGISNFPLGFALFCKYARPFASAATRQQLFEERRQEKERLEREQSQNKDSFVSYENPLDDPSFATKCLVWAMAQLGCVISGLFDIYPNIVIKGALVFHILMTVQDSIETRPILQHKEELKRKRDEQLKLESALFWQFFMPKFLWRWMGYESAVHRITRQETANATDSINVKKPSKLILKVQKTKKLVRGKRETAAEDLVWGALQIAYVVLDLTEKQAIGTAILVYLCTLLENVLTVAMSETAKEKDEDETNPKKSKDWKKKINWFKISWIVLCLYLNLKWFLS